MSSTTPEMQALKAQLRSTWMAGDFGQVAKIPASLERLWTENNRATDGTTQIKAEYLEVVAVRA